MAEGAGHVDIYRRTDPVMYTLEDRSAFDRIIYGRTPKFDTQTSDHKWQLWCVYYDGSVLTTFFANDSKYNCVWDNRASYFSFLPAGATFPQTEVTGTFTPSGLNVAGRITVVSIDNTTWTPLPATPLADRNAMSIINRSGQNIVINYNNTVVGYVGVPIDNQSERFYDITENIVVYAKSQTSACSVIVEELA